MYCIQNNLYMNWWYSNYYSCISCLLRKENLAQLFFFLQQTFILLNAPLHFSLHLLFFQCTTRGQPLTINGETLCSRSTVWNQRSCHENHFTKIHSCVLKSENTLGWSIQCHKKRKISNLQNADGVETSLYHSCLCCCHHQPYVCSSWRKTSEMNSNHQEWHIHKWYQLSSFTMTSYSKQSNELWDW